MARVLLLSTTTGYQTRAFGAAAAALGVDLVFATDRCHVLENPWQDGAIPIRFHEEHAAADAIVLAARRAPIDGVLAVGDRPTVIAALAAERLGLPGHPPEAAAIARDKERTRERLRRAGLPVPWFLPARLDQDWRGLARLARFPAVVKPVALSASRGVMRADNEAQLAEALRRLRAIMALPELRAERNAAHERVLVEGFIPGREYALEGLMHRGRLIVLAVFEKPDPLDGPFFEETIYVTPPASNTVARRIIEAVARAAEAIGLQHGPIHAECRVNGEGVFVLEVAARPIGGLCARALRFERLARPSDGASSGPQAASLEELLLRHALGEDPALWAREADASGVMMIPIPAAGIYREVAGLDDARRVPDVEDVVITAKPDQRLVPLPEGASYLGFIFARATRASAVERALRTAHACLRFRIEPAVRVLQSGHGSV